MPFVIKNVVTGPLKTNAYLVYEKVSKEAALFDVGGPIEPLIQLIKVNNLKLKYVFCTHGHFDHIMGVSDVRKMFSEVLVCIHKAEMDVIAHLGPIARMFQFSPEEFGEPDIFIENNDYFKLGEIEIQAIHAPGHSPGSICFYWDNSLISGDVLFYHGVGRVDLYGGSLEDLERSIRKLYMLPDETIVYPGHESITSIGTEKNENPFVKMKDFVYENFSWVIPKELAIIHSPNYQSEYFQLQQKGIKCLISLGTEFPDIKALQEAHITHIYLPITKCEAPNEYNIFLFLRFLENFLPSRPIAVHCLDDYTHSCMMVAIYLIWKGKSPIDVVKKLESIKKGCMTPEQITFLNAMNENINNWKKKYEEWKKQANQAPIL